MEVASLILRWIRETDSVGEICIGVELGTVRCIQDCVRLFGVFVDLSFDIEYVCSLEIALLASVRLALFVRHCHALR